MSGTAPKTLGISSIFKKIRIALLSFGSLESLPLGLSFLVVFIPIELSPLLIIFGKEKIEGTTGRSW